MNSTTKKQNDPDWRQIAELYEAALKLAPEARSVWLESVRESNPDAYDPLYSLILQLPKVEKFLEKSVAEEVEISVVKLDLPTFKAGDILNGYKILGILGTGGSAKVYLAKDNQLGRRVAIKVFLNQTDEARTLASLEHDNIVKVYAEEVLEAEGLRLISMQLVPGPSLDVILEKIRPYAGKGLSGETLLKIVDELASQHSHAALVSSQLLQERNELAAKDYVDGILWLGMKMCDALSYAHSQQVLHLDVKPSNIILSQFGRPFLTDFGVSLTSRVKDLAANLGGTPKYMPPEQLEMFRSQDISSVARGLSPATDLYSLGLVLKEFFLIPVRAEFLDRAYLDWILAKVTDPDAKKRYASAEAFKAALQSVQEIRSLKKAVGENPRGNVFSRHPIIALTLIGAAPQLGASFIGTIYNAVRIVHTLTPDQGKLFQWLNVTLTPLIFVVITGIWLAVLLKIRLYVKDPTSFSDRPRVVKILRRHLLNIPRWGVFVTTLGWLPAALLYPLLLHFTSGGLAPETLVHFVASFTLSWFIALSYSYLLHTFICIKLLYKEFWYGCTEVQATARSEVNKTLRPVRGCLIAIIIVPLAAAILVLVTGKQDVPPGEWKLYQLLVASLIMMGALGTHFALSIGQSLVKTLLQFTGPKKE